MLTVYGKGSRTDLYDGGVMENGVMLQSFHWDLPADGNFYKNLKERAEELHDLGITSVWMPPAAKGTSDQDVGYGSYDYWDLGEFDQKGNVRTKYGTKEELLRAIEELHKHNISVYADMVFNHKGGADETEVFKAVMVDQNNRNADVGEVHDIEGWTRFTFPGRNGKYSEFIWNFNHFTGVDYDNRTGTKAIYRIIGDGKYWNEGTDKEKGNFDYLMNADIDHNHPDVREELKRVTDFMLSLGYDGFRYDALKHISFEFIDDLSVYILQKRKDFYFVGEYWQDNESTINHYLGETGYNIDLFDVPLHFNFYEASCNPDYDMRKIFDGSLVQAQPQFAVTFCDNHDSQPGQALESWVKPWFKKIAYALMLLRKDGYPCIFEGDLTGIETQGYPGIYDDIARMMSARKKFCYGQQDEYFVSESKIGWVRRGNEEHPNPMAVLISSKDMDEERMFVGESEKGKTYTDLSGQNQDIVIDDEGFGLFTVGPGTVTYWAEKGK